MASSYRAALTDGLSFVTSRSPESIRRFLRERTHWPPGIYEITEEPPRPGDPQRRWGVAIKRADGSVILVPDPLA